jgi:hypothetical protein
LTIIFCPARPEIIIGLPKLFGEAKRALFLAREK